MSAELESLLDWLRAEIDTAQRECRGQRAKTLADVQVEVSRRFLQVQRDSQSGINPPE